MRDDGGAACQLSVQRAAAERCCIAEAQVGCTGAVGSTGKLFKFTLTFTGGGWGVREQGRG